MRQVFQRIAYPENLFLKHRKVIAAPLFNLDIGKRCDVLPHLSEPMVAHFERFERAADKLGQIRNANPVDARMTHGIEDELLGRLPMSLLGL